VRSLGPEAREALAMVHALAGRDNRSEGSRRSIASHWRRDDEITAWGKRTVTADKVEQWRKKRNEARYGEIDPKRRFGNRKRLPQPPSGRTPVR
jgi:hypothetical protein